MPARARDLPALVVGEGQVTEVRSPAAHGMHADCATPRRVLAGQFWWPAPRVVAAGGMTLVPDRDAVTRMPALDPPPGRHASTVMRPRLPMEWLGLGLGVVALLALPWPVALPLPLRTSSRAP